MSMITIKKTYGEKEKLSWLIAARLPKKEAETTRYKTMQYICVDEDGTAVCTDGHRLHALHNIGSHYPQLSKPGFYQVWKDVKAAVDILPVESADKFPNWKTAILTEQAGDVKFSWECGNFNVAIASLFRAFPEFTALDIGYIRPATLAFNKWQVLWRDARSQVQFQAGDLLTVAMPITSGSTVDGLETIGDAAVPENPANTDEE